MNISKIAIAICMYKTVLSVSTIFLHFSVGGGIVSNGMHIARGASDGA